MQYARQPQQGRGLAQQKGISNATQAYAWRLRQSGITARIVGAIKTAAQALGVSLDADELAALAVHIGHTPCLVINGCKTTAGSPAAN